MFRQILWYSFILIAAFIVLTRSNAANRLLRGGGQVFGQSVGILQGRVVSFGERSRVGAIAR